MLEKWHDMETYQKIEIGLALLLTLIAVLQAHSLVEAGVYTIAGVFIAHGATHMIVDIKDGSMKHSIFSLAIFVLGFIFVTAMFLSSGSCCTLNKAAAAENPLTGECSVKSASDNFPWYYDESSCNLTEICGEGDQHKTICRQKHVIEVGRGCSGAIDAKLAVTGVNDTTSIPPSCFDSQDNSVSARLPNATPEDQMMLTENGPELAD